jgi:tRNA nucleotidyltransferase/poly(A) polymerase
MAPMTSRHPQRTFQVLLHQPAVRELLAAADAVDGHVECHLVGGVLRDRVLGLPSKDLDLVVSGRGQEIAERLAEALPARLVLLGGKDFAAYRLVSPGLTVDIWDRAGTTLHQDLARRDFTVNSIALDARTGEVIDPFGGLSDLGCRALRATTSESFTGDPLRVLRLPRLLLRLPDFTLDADTLALAKRSSPGLADVASERVRDELLLLFEHPDAALGLAVLMGLNLYPGLFLGHPGEQGSPGRALTEFRSLSACLIEGARPEVVRLASLFANLPGAEPRAALDRFRDSGYLTRSLAQDVARLLELKELPGEDLEMRRFIHTTGLLWATAASWLAARAAAHGERWREKLAALVDLAKREGAELIDPPRLLTGEDVQEILGIPAGPAVGRALAAIREAQVEGRVRTREEAVQMATTRSAS